MSSTIAVRVGDLKSQLFTLPQAAKVLKVDLGTVRKAVEHRIKATYVLRGGRRFRAIDGLDIVYFISSASFTPKVRTSLYQALKEAPEDQMLSGTMTVLVDDPSGRKSAVDIPLDRPVNDALAGIDALTQSELGVDTGGKINGTGIAAHRIAALSDGGMPKNEILRDYPKLTASQIDASIAYAQSHPKQGRPYPNRTVKSVLRHGRGGLRRAFAAALEE